MRASRLRHALAAGGVSLPRTGGIVLVGPDGLEDAVDLPRDRLTVVSPFRPVHDAFAAAGYAIRPDCSDLSEQAAAIVCLPRARDHARARIAEASGCLVPGAQVIVDGSRTDGIDGFARACRAEGIALSEPVAKAHGKVFALSADDVPAGWAAQPRSVGGGFVTMPGVFSADGPDPGSMLLAAALPAVLPARLVDLGAGWGYLSAAALTRQGPERIDLVEADHVTLDCARRNVHDPRAHFHWADARDFRPDRPAGGVICNPPFHQGRRADPELGLSFIAAAAGMLARDGILWLVANRHLPYRDALARLFREAAEVGGSNAFSVWQASGPLSQKPGAGVPQRRPSRP